MLPASHLVEDVDWVTDLADDGEDLDVELELQQTGTVGASLDDQSFVLTQMAVTNDSNATNGTDSGTGNGTDNANTTNASSGDTAGDLTCDHDACCEGDEFGCANKVCTDEKMPYYEDRKCVDFCGNGMTPNDEKVCTMCPLGTYADHQKHKCVSECPEGKAGGEGIGNAKRDCTSCKPKFADHINHVCALVCPEGTLQNSVTNNCDPNPPCESGHMCVLGKCTDAHKKYSDNMVCVHVCGAGRVPHPKTRVCEECPEGKVADHESHTCVESGNCPARTFEWAPTRDCVNKPFCTAGEGCVDGRCMSKEFQYADHDTCGGVCGGGRTPNMATKICENCPNGTYADHKIHKCVEQCAPGMAAGEGYGNSTKDCTICPHGKYADHSAHACVATCPKGKAAGHGTDTMERKDCKDCPEGKFADHKKHKCVIATECSVTGEGVEGTRECKEGGANATNSNSSNSSNSSSAAMTINVNGDPCCAAGTCSCLADGTCIAECPTAVTETSYSPKELLELELLDDEA